MSAIRPTENEYEDASTPTLAEAIDVHIANCGNLSALVPLALTISSNSVSVVIFVDETVHSMPRPLSYDKSEMSRRIKRIPRALAHPSTPPPWSQNPQKRKNL